MSKKSAFQGVVAGAAVLSLLNIGPVLEVKAEAAIPSGSDTAAIASNEEVTPASDTLVWYYKTENGKKYMRLYDSYNGVWLTDWILCE